MNNKLPYGITYIDDVQPWLIALPDAGNSLQEAEKSEFAKIVELVGEDVFNTRMGTWCCNYGHATRWDGDEGFFWDDDGYVQQYDGTEESWCLDREDYRGYGTGFRPVLIPVAPDTFQPDPSRIAHMKDGETIALGTLYMAGKPLKNPLDPTEVPNSFTFPAYGDVPRYEKGASLEIGNTSEKPEEQIQFIKFGDKLISDRVLIGCISLTDLDQNLVVDKIPEKSRSSKQVAEAEKSSSKSEMVNLWARVGVSLSATPEEAEILCGDDYNKAKDILLNLIRSDRCFLDGETYFPNEDVLEEGAPEVQFDFDFGPTPLQAVPQKFELNAKDAPLHSFDSRLADASSRAGKSNSEPETKNRQPEH